MYMYNHYKLLCYFIYVTCWTALICHDISTIEGT